MARPRERPDESAGTDAALAGLIGVSEKTAKAWLEDRTREVREAKLARAVRATD
jgi:hypothetical protein